MTPRQPEVMLIEDILKRRIKGYEYSEEYRRIKIGYEGEKWFADHYLIEPHLLECYNLFLPYRKSRFEIDRLIISGETIYAFDVKNYFGSYELSEGGWMKEGIHIQSPIRQYEVMSSNIKSLIRNMGLPHQVETKIIFVQNSFSLKGEHDLGIITNLQIPQLMQKVNSSKPVSELEYKIKKYLEEIHEPMELYNKIPKFNISDVDMSLQCRKCGNKMELSSDKTQIMKCTACLFEDKKREIVKRTLLEYYLLVNRPILKRECGKFVNRTNRNLISRVLNENFNETDDGYIPKKEIHFD